MKRSEIRVTRIATSHGKKSSKIRIENEAMIGNHKIYYSLLFPAVSRKISWYLCSRRVQMSLNFVAEYLLLNEEKKVGESEWLALYYT